MQFKPAYLAFKVQLDTHLQSQCQYQDLKILRLGLLDSICAAKN